MGRRYTCIVKPGAAEDAWEYRTDGKETVKKSAGFTAKTILKWEGAALLINTIVSGKAKNYTLMDRWKLSRDGKLLTVRRQTVDLYGERESVLVYERD